MKTTPLSYSDVFNHLYQLIVRSFWVECHQYVFHVLFQCWRCVRIDQFWVNIFVQFHDSDQVLLKFLKLPSVCSNHFFLLIDNLSKFVDFSCVKVNSILKVWTLLLVFSFLWLVLILLLNFLYQLSKVSVLLGNFSHWAFIIKLTAVFLVLVLLRLDLGCSMIERKLAAFNSRLVANDHILNRSFRVSSAISHEIWSGFYFELLMFLFIFINDQISYMKKGKIRNWIKRLLIK